MTMFMFVTIPRFMFGLSTEQTERMVAEYFDHMPLWLTIPFIQVMYPMDSISVWQSSEIHLVSWRPRLAIGLGDCLQTAWVVGLTDLA